MTSVTTASVEDNGEDKFDLVDDPSWDTQLASDKESKLVEELRNVLGSMSLLDGPHANFPEVTGEYNLLRFLRGCNGDVKEAANLFEKHINLRKEFNLDEMRDRMVSLLDEKPLFGQEDLIHGETFAKHFRQRTLVREQSHSQPFRTQLCETCNCQA